MRADGELQSGGQRLHLHKNSQMTTIDAIFTSTCHIKHLNPWTISQSAVYLLIKFEPFEGHQSTHGCQTGLRVRPE